MVIRWTRHVTKVFFLIIQVRRTKSSHISEFTLNTMSLNVFNFFEARTRSRSLVNCSNHRKFLMFQRTARCKINKFLHHVNLTIENGFIIQELMITDVHKNVFLILWKLYFYSNLFILRLNTEGFYY